MKKNKKIGFIGTGLMGNSMAGHLQQAGYQLHVYTRTKNKAENLLKKGAIWERSVSELAAASDIVITIIGTPEDVEDVYLGEDGIIANTKAGSYIIDMTTSKPALAEEIYKKAAERNIAALDAPVSGGDTGAQNGKLAIMVGGDQDAFDTILPIFKLMGTNIVLQGPAGAGQHTKIVNQIAIAPGMIGVCEALIYAKQSRLDPETVLSSIETGAAGSWSLSNYGSRLIKGDYHPGFAIKHYLKDMRIALESSKEMGLSTPGLEMAYEMYNKVAEMGEMDSGIQALLKYYTDKNL